MPSIRVTTGGGARAPCRAASASTVATAPPQQPALTLSTYRTCHVCARRATTVIDNVHLCCALCQTSYGARHTTECNQCTEVHMRSVAHVSDAARRWLAAHPDTLDTAHVDDVDQVAPRQACGQPDPRRRARQR